MAVGLTAPLTAPLEEWQKHEKHDEDCLKVLKEIGSLDSKGRIRSWKGAEFFRKIEALGHSSMGFTTCKCREEA